MSKAIKHRSLSDSFSEVGFAFDTNVENFKRKRALQSLSILDQTSKLFFQRMLEVKKIKDFIFVTKSQRAGR